MTLHMTHHFECDNDKCGQEFMADTEIEMPPMWMGMQVMIADTEGLIPDQEREIFHHFCKLECLREFLASDSLDQRMVMIDAQDEIDEESEFGSPDGLVT